jgi:hypothetical protein
VTQEKAAEVVPSRCSEIPQLLFTLQVIPIVSLAKPFLISKAIIWCRRPLVKVSMPFYGNYDVSSGYVIPGVKDLEFGKKGRELELANGASTAYL